LQEIIELKVNDGKEDDNMIYKDYNNLMVHLIKNKIEKGILIGKALCSKKEKVKMPIVYQK